jgi:hypothetical protein
MSKNFDHNSKSYEKDFLEFAAAGNLEGLEAIAQEHVGINKYVLTNALIEICNNYQSTE